MIIHTELRTDALVERTHASLHTEKITISFQTQKHFLQKLDLTHTAFPMLLCLLGLFPQR